MKTKYVVEINHRAMNEHSLYERVRNALFEWHAGEQMVRGVSVVPQPAQPQEQGNGQPTPTNKQRVEMPESCHTGDCPVSFRCRLLRNKVHCHARLFGHFTRL